MRLPLILALMVEKVHHSALRTVKWLPLMPTLREAIIPERVTVCTHIAVVMCGQSKSVLIAHAQLFCKYPSAASFSRNAVSAYVANGVPVRSCILNSAFGIPESFRIFKDSGMYCSRRYFAALTLCFLGSLYGTSSHILLQIFPHNMILHHARICNQEIFSKYTTSFSRSFMRRSNHSLFSAVTVSVRSYSPKQNTLYFSPICTSVSG